jgi:O-antigen ligase
MNHTLAPAGDHGRGRRDPIRTALGALLLVLTGVALGIQYVNPNKRALPVLVGLVVFGLAWRIDMITGLGILVATLPYPKSTVFGNTNLAFILLLLIIWMLRVTQRQSPGFARTPIDAPIGGLLIAYIISFYNLARPEYVPFALQNIQLLVAGILVFYLIVGNVRTEQDLKRFHSFQLFSAFTITALALWELNHPGTSLVPGWIDFVASGEDFSRHNVRVGGPFSDYELLSEYCAISLLLVVLWLVRARDTFQRVLVGGLFLITVFTQFTTVTRGAMVSLSAALVYLTWIMRRHVRVVPFTVLTSAIVGGFFAMNFYVSHFTRSGNLIDRLVGTEFAGVVPDNRRQAWADGWERWMQHPILGHGPYYSMQEGTRMWFWPHNGYLYIGNLVGIVGLTFFLWILWKLWVMTRPRTDSLEDPSYARAYLMVAHLQLLVFVIDQTKIDFLRNPIYQFQVWLMFASIAAAYRIDRLDRGRAPQLVR